MVSGQWSVASEDEGGSPRSGRPQLGASSTPMGEEKSQLAEKALWAGWMSEILAGRLGWADGVVQVLEPAAKAVHAEWHSC